MRVRSALSARLSRPKPALRSRNRSRRPDAAPSQFRYPWSRSCATIGANSRSNDWPLAFGKAGIEDLVFARWDGGPWPPDRLSSTWAKTVSTLKPPKLPCHALRNTHATQLIAAGLDVVTVSRRIGHSNPNV